MIILNESDFRSVGNINTEGKYSLRLEMIEELIRDVSDELYTITNKIENIGRLASTIGIKDAKILTIKINEDLENILDINYNYNWQKLLYEINEKSEE